MANARKFHQLSQAERITILIDQGLIDSTQAATLMNNDGLEPTTANHMIENFLSIYGVPFGVAFNFIVNGQAYLVPMAVEEPSVIAAASAAAKTIAKTGGFKAMTRSRLMIGQVALMQVPDLEKAEAAIHSQLESIQALADAAYPSIVQRGGGVKNITTKIIPATAHNQEFLCVYVHLDAQEAMGANMLNTILESLVPTLENLTDGNALMSILSNYATDAIVEVTCELPFDALDYHGLPGKELAQRLVAASELAYSDVYRAATHNKGIMNGIDALVLATGNDWRAIEAGAHAYASRDGQYRGLSRWTLTDHDSLLGTMQIPMPIGTVGGSIRIHKLAKISLAMLDAPSASQLGEIIAAVGLAQNFAAMRALVSDGIQKGHMALQAKSLALAVGAEEHEVNELVRLLKKSRMNQETAKTLLEEIRNK